MNVTKITAKVDIGESKSSLKHQLADHRGYIVNKHVDKAIEAQYNLPGHSLASGQSQGLSRSRSLEQVMINAERRESIIS